MFYDCLDSPCTDHFGIPDFNIPLIISDDRPILHKRARYSPDLLPYTISVAFENFSSTLNTTSDSRKLFLLPYDDPNHLHYMNKYELYHGRVKVGYCCRKHDEKICNKNMGLYYLHALIRTRNFITIMGFPD